jgi:uncharacterized protein (TIGR00269 family)
MNDSPLKLCLTPTHPEPVVWTKDDEQFVVQFEQRVQDTISRYDLLSPTDKILVAVSGGKDSTAVLHVLHKLGYPVEAVTVDAHIGCYTQQNLENIRAVCAKLRVPLHEIPFRKVFGASLCYIRDYLKERGHNYKSCTVCGVLRRYLLNRKARELKATKLVLGHNLDDEAQVILMNLLKNRPELNARLGPRTHELKDDRFVARVKPLYLIREDEVVRYSKLMAFPVKYGKCPCSAEGFRNAVRDFLNEYERMRPGVKENIVRVFLEQRAQLQERFANAQLSCCLECDEPARDRLCRACALLALVREPLEPEQLGTVQFPAGP